MGNYKFRLSYMMPNAWFYKLKDMGRSKKKQESKPLKRKPHSASSTSQKPKNYKPIKADEFSNSPAYPEVLDTQFLDPPRKSSKRSRSERKTIYKPSPKLVSPLCSNGFSSQEKLNSDWKRTSFPVHISPEHSSSPLSSLEYYFGKSLLFDSDEDDGFIVPSGSSEQQLASMCSSCKCNASTSSEDIGVKVDKEVFQRKATKKPESFNRNPQLNLPPIVTKPAKFNDKNTDLTMLKRSSTKLESKAQRKTTEHKATNPAPRKSFSHSSGIRLRTNSPRIMRRKLQPCGARRSLSRARNGPVSESVVVVKSSVDPQKDFRESMVEMIVENNIRASKDLEELLACYLSLNSNEYHDLIVNAFEQIWLGLTHLRL